jgi:hypothetical protein
MMLNLKSILMIVSLAWLSEYDILVIPLCQSASIGNAEAVIVNQQPGDDHFNLTGKPTICYQDFVFFRGDKFYFITCLKDPCTYFITEDLASNIRKIPSACPQPQFLSLIDLDLDKVNFAVKMWMGGFDLGSPDLNKESCFMNLYLWVGTRYANTVARVLSPRFVTKYIIDSYPVIKEKKLVSAMSEYPKLNSNHNLGIRGCDVVCPLNTPIYIFDGTHNLYDPCESADTDPLPCRNQGQE